MSVCSLHILATPYSCTWTVSQVSANVIAQTCLTTSQPDMGFSYDHRQPLTATLAAAGFFTSLLSIYPINSIPKTWHTYIDWPERGSTFARCCVAGCGLEIHQYALFQRLDINIWNRVGLVVFTWWDSKFEEISSCLSIIFRFQRQFEHVAYSSLYLASSR